GPPGGRKREPRAAAARAGGATPTRTSHAPARGSLVHPSTCAPVGYAQARLDTVLRGPSMSEVLPESERRQCKFFAFCGIGNPGAFFDDLKNWGFSVVGERSFADHHRYSSAEIRDLESTATASGAHALICTEKDVFNLPLSLA